MRLPPAKSHRGRYSHASQPQVPLGLSIVSPPYWRCRIAGRANPQHIELIPVANPHGKQRTCIDLPVLRGRTALVLVVAEGASLVFVSTVAVDEDVSAECILVLWAMSAPRQSSGKSLVSSRTTSLGPRGPELSPQIGLREPRRGHSELYGV
jgi:hypothetical protein